MCLLLIVPMAIAQSRNNVYYFPKGWCRPQSWYCEVLGALLQAPPCRMNGSGLACVAGKDCAVVARWLHGCGTVAALSAALLRRWGGPLLPSFRTMTLYLDWGLQLRCQAAFASLQHCVAQSRYNVLFLNVFIILVQMSTADPSLRTML